MKTLSLIFALVLGLTATAATARSKDSCEAGAQFTYLTATMRDEGRTIEESKMLLAFLGLKPEPSEHFINLVYVRFINSSPEVLKDAFFSFCMSKGT